MKKSFHARRSSWTYRIRLMRVTPRLYQRLRRKPWKPHCRLNIHQPLSLSPVFSLKPKLNHTQRLLVYRQVYIQQSFGVRQRQTMKFSIRRSQNQVCQQMYQCRACTIKGEGAMRHKRSARKSCWSWTNFGFARGFWNLTKRTMHDQIEDGAKVSLNTTYCELPDTSISLLLPEKMGWSIFGTKSYVN
jgi:hypothetical protein